MHATAPWPSFSGVTDRAGRVFLTEIWNDDGRTGEARTDSLRRRETVLGDGRLERHHLPA